MVEPVSLAIAIGFLVKSAPGWFHSLQDILLGQGKDLALTKGKERFQNFLDEKKHLHHMELALQNAAERGLRRFQTLEARDRYRCILQIVSQSGSDALRREALKLFTFSDTPDLAALAEKYNLSQRITALARGVTHEEVDAAPYLSSFFDALIAELYNDPLFRDQISGVLHIRAELKQQRTLEDILVVLNRIETNLPGSYTVEQFQTDVDTYVTYLESKLRYHKFAGIVFRGDEDKAPELDGIFVPLNVDFQSQTPAREQGNNDVVSALEQSPYLVLLGGPGSGKSTSTRYVAWSHARVNAQVNQVRSATISSRNLTILSGKPIPLRIELRLFSEVRKQDVGCSFLSYVTEVLLRQDDVQISKQMFKELLDRRAMLLLFDGLDEVPTLAERRQLVEAIETFAQSYPGNRILVTSRPIGYDLAGFANRLFQHAFVQEFNDEQIRQFLQSWYQHVLKYSSLPADVQQELDLFYSTLMRNERLHNLARNPLLLTVMTALHRYERLPDERVLIYEKCADLLLDTWAKLKYEDKRWKDLKMSKQNQAACLAHLGFALHQRSQEPVAENTSQTKNKPRSEQETAADVPASFIRKAIKRFLTEQNLLSGAEQDSEAERFLELVRIEAGLIVSRGTDETGENLYRVSGQKAPSF